jgi:hypothetical protein
MIKLRQNFRSIGYAIAIGLVLYLIRGINQQGGKSDYLIAVATGTFILILELYTVRHTAEDKLIQVGLPAVMRYPEIKSFILHYFLPIMLFGSYSLFTYVNPYDSLNVIAIPFVTISYLFVFINTRAYYEDKFKLELTTHGIYFFIILFSRFTFANSVLNIAGQYNLNTVILAFILAGLFLGGFLLIFFENVRLDIKLTLVILLSSILLGVTSAALYLSLDSSLRNSFIIICVFYFISASIQHKIEGSLQIGIIAEYISILALCFVLLYGIN